MSSAAPASADTFGATLKFLRKRAHLTQRELGIAVGYSETYITRLENGSRLPDPTTVKARFVEALHLQHEPHLAQQLIGLAALSHIASSDDKAVAGASWSAALPHNLPTAVPALIGRDDLLAKTVKALRGQTCQTLVLTGPGGVGKTTLALHAALRFAQSPDDLAVKSIVFVDLSSVQHAEHVVAAIARSLQAVHGHAPARASIDALKAHLRERAMLLVLDNFEHVEAAAPQMTELAAASPALKLLVTSRIALRQLGGMSIDVSPLQRNSAIALFNLRAHEADPHFSPRAETVETLDQLCQLLDGLPLAIELVAARIKLMTPQQLLARLTRDGGRLQVDLVADGLSNLPARQRTLRNTIAWSYYLLTPAEQTLFRQLSVFTGGFMLPAAEAVLSSSSNDDDTVILWNAITSLMHKSLLKHDIVEHDLPRFTQLETVREFARTLLNAEEADATLQRHADYYFKLALEAEPHINSPAPTVWMDALAREQANLRAALQWQLKHDAPSALRFCVAMGAYWHSRGLLIEGRRALTAALEQTVGAPPTLATAGALYWLGRIDRRVNDWASALQHAQESVALHRALGDDRRLALAVLALGWASYSIVGLAEAARCFEEGLSVYRRLGDQRGIAQALLDLSLIAEHNNEYELSKRYLVESRALFKQAGDEIGLGLVNGGLATLACLHGDYAKSHAFLAEGIDLLKRAGEVGFVAGYELELGESCYFLGDFEGAETAWNQSLKMHRELGVRVGAARTQFHLARLCRRDGDVAAAKAHLVDALIVFQQTQRDPMIARSIAGLGGIALLEGKVASATTLLSAAQHYFDHHPKFLAPADVAEYESDIAVCRSASDAEAFATVWAAGQSLSLEQAAHLALADDLTAAL